MAKSFAYWVIVAGNTPTAFRAREQEPLLPTLRQLQRTQSNVTLSWFERNRLWTSAEEAEADQARRKTLRRERGQDWRPGGVHKDPHARVELTRDQKRARFKRQRSWPETPATGSATPPSGGESHGQPSAKSEMPRKPVRTFRPKPAGAAGSWRPKAPTDRRRPAPPRNPRGPRGGSSGGRKGPR